MKKSILSVRGEKYAEKEILEKVLEIALSTGGDFAEIFEEKKYKMVFPC